MPDTNVPTSDKIRNDGGPAFPRTPTDLYDGHAGMTLRQWYAGQAIVGQWASMNPGFHDKSSCEETARVAFMMADALLAEGDK